MPTALKATNSSKSTENPEGRKEGWLVYWGKGKKKEEKETRRTPAGK